MKKHKAPLHLWEGYGIELEYMIVQRDSLAVLPITDKLIHDEVGAYLSDVSFGDIAWSNELVLHVVELKTDGPAKSLKGLAEKFQAHVRKINTMLLKYDAMLLPTGAHPLMNPYTDTKLWPHEHNAVYEAYNRIFDCRGHGWANLQSTHLNLPFANDEEFGKLHAAIRVLLPLIPAISASSPIMDGQVTGLQDTRLEVYRHNQDKIPSIAGHVIPEPFFTEKDYEEGILKRIYIDVAPYDTEGVLQEEFLNSRGAIARFTRNAIEIRLIDIQECPEADLAVLRAIVSVLKALVSERWATIAHLKIFDAKRLAEVLLDVIRNGQDAVVADAAYLKCFGFSGSEPRSVREVWQQLVQQIDASEGNQELAGSVGIILEQGNLATRILKATGDTPTTDTIQHVYRQLGSCLQQGKFFP